MLLYMSWMFAVLIVLATGLTEVVSVNSWRRTVRSACLVLTASGSHVVDCIGIPGHSPNERIHTILLACKWIQCALPRPFAWCRLDRFGRASTLSFSDGNPEKVLKPRLPLRRNCACAGESLHMQAPRRLLEVHLDRQKRHLNLLVPVTLFLKDGPCNLI